MSTAISDLYEPIRAFLGDFDASVRMYADESIAAVVKALVRCGEVSGLSIDGTGVNILPGLTTPDLYARVVYRACLAFVEGPQADGYSYRTRAMSESFAGSKQQIAALREKLHEVENGGANAFASWSDFHTWALGVTGINLWAAMAEMQVNAPVAAVTIGRSGIQVNE